MTRSIAVLALLSLFAAVAAAKELPAPEPPAFVVKVAKTTIGTCSTDGGTEKCSAGVKFLGAILPALLNERLQGAPIPCAAKGAATVRLGYDYNGGQVIVLDSEKTQARWPDCVKKFAADAAPILLAAWKKIFELDPLIDTNSEYKISLQLVKPPSE